MELMDQNVRHARFGVGTIVEMQPRRITVVFAQPYGQKRFVYPDAFETYLSVDDQALRSAIDLDIGARHAQIEAEKKALQERLEAQYKQAAEEKSQERARASRTRRAPATTARAKGAH